MMNNKGQMLGVDNTFNLFTFIVVAFLAVVLFSGLMYSMDLINGVMNQVGIQNDQMTSASSVGYTNMTLAAERTFGKATDATRGLTLVSMAIIFSMIMGNIIINLFVRKHPVLFIFYVLIIALAVIFSVPVANAYQTLLDSGGPLTSYMQTHTMSNYILQNLPVVVTILGVLGGALMFINMIRGEPEGTL